MHLARRPLLALAVAILAACTGAAPTVEVQGTVPSTTASTPPATSAPSSSTATTAAPATPAPTTTQPRPPLAWEPCGLAARRLQCATLEVPLDYADPAAGTIELALRRKPATDPGLRIGSLLVNPGGPGVPGTALVDAATSAFSSTLTRRFDIVGWDPRGTGRSNPVDCVDELDPYFALDPTPETDADKQALVDAARELAEACEERNGDLLAHISTQDSARDMDEIRKALGEEQISYFGFSYGSELGATYVTMFPSSVRAAVLDGAIDPNADPVDEARRQLVSLERSLDAFLADCAADGDCAFHRRGEPGAALDRLLARLESSPLQVGRRTVDQGVGYSAILASLYDPADWPSLADALDRADGGDGSGLLGIHDASLERADDGSYSNLYESLVAIRCLDRPGPTELDAPDRLAPEFERLAPRLGRAMAYGYYCTFWPVPPVTPLTVSGRGAGPVVVVGTTGDAITPIESSRRLADELEEGVLVTVEAEGHTGYGRNGCSTRVVDRYLTRLEVPADGVVCR